MVILQKLFTLMEGEWSFYRGGHFKWRENGHVTKDGHF